MLSAVSFFDGVGIRKETENIFHISFFICRSQLITAKTPGRQDAEDSQ
jgi:hypothetical protein